MLTKGIQSTHKRKKESFYFSFYILHSGHSGYCEASGTDWVFLLFHNYLLCEMLDN